MRCTTFLATLTLSLGALQAASPVRDLLKKGDDWYESQEAETILTNVLSWQSANGDWPKNTDTTQSANQRPSKGTFDNSATVPELRFLAKAYAVTENAAYEQAFTLGLTHIFNSQYANGGFPQRNPAGDGYAQHITFNDGTMIHLLEFLQDVGNPSKFTFIDADTKKRARTAVDRGIQCILACQIRIDGKPTVWCAQHHRKTLEPVGARSYELPSLSGAESAGVLRFLMKLEKPSKEIVAAIEAGTAWYQQSQIRGIRVDKVDGNRVVIPDPEARPVWARFYDLKTQKPFFCGRDGIKKETLAEIEHERRNGYAWYTNAGHSVAKAHAEWKAPKSPSGT